MAHHTRRAENGGEQAIRSPAGLLHVDGYDPSTRTVYEFHGCLWRGCPRCFNHTRHSTSTIHPDRTLEQVYEASSGIWVIQSLSSGNVTGTGK